MFLRTLKICDKAGNDMPKIVWLDKPEDHDYGAAADYLELIAGIPDIRELAKDMVTAAHRGLVVNKHAKDILRAAQLKLLDADDPYVAKDLAKIKSGVALSPVLLVRGKFVDGRPLVIADGYHRVCASYHHDPDTRVPAVLVDYDGHTDHTWGM